jgi:hypothetical protein
MKMMMMATKDDQVLNIERRRNKKSSSRQRYKIRNFVLSVKGTIGDMIRLRINWHTIKRGL